MSDSKNTNCLEGLRCPQCKQEGALQIEGTALFLVSDDGTDAHSDIEWGNKSFARCPACDHKGKLGEFYISVQVENPPMRTYEVVIYETRRFVGRVEALGSNEVNLLFQGGDDVIERCKEDYDYYVMEIKDVTEVKP